MKLTPINEFAKIIPASSGQQVLFFLDYYPKDDSEDKESNTAIEATIRCMATFEEMQFEVNLNFYKRLAAISAFNKLDDESADRVINQVIGDLSRVVIV